MTERVCHSCPMHGSWHCVKIVDEPNKNRSISRDVFTMSLDAPTNLITTMGMGQTYKTVQVKNGVLLFWREEKQAKKNR